MANTSDGSYTEDRPDKAGFVFFFQSLLPFGKIKGKNTNPKIKKYMILINRREFKKQQLEEKLQQQKKLYFLRQPLIQRVASFLSHSFLRKEGAVYAKRRTSISQRIAKPDRSSATKLNFFRKRPVITAGSDAEDRKLVVPRKKGIRSIQGKTSLPDKNGPISF